MTSARGILQDLRAAIEDLDAHDPAAAKSRLYELRGKIERYGIAESTPIEIEWDEEEELDEDEDEESEGISDAAAYAIFRAILAAKS